MRLNKIYFIDGRFKEFPHELDYSLPDCNTTIRNSFLMLKYTYYVLTSKKKDRPYLDLATNVITFLSLDSDDYVHPEHSNWNKFYGELQEVYDEPELLYFLWYWVYR